MLRRRWRPGEVGQLVITVWVTLIVGLGGGAAAADSTAGSPSIARPRHREVGVSRGSMTFIRPSDLDLDRRAKMAAADLTSVCQISVVSDDPNTLRVGRIQPEVFDCDFPPDVVRYVHNGNPILDVDRARLVVRQATDTDTTVEEIVLTIRITSPAGLIFDQPSTAQYTSGSAMSSVERFLTVDLSKSPYSDPISAATLRFRYNFTGGAVCTVYFSDRLPTQFRSQALVASVVVTSDGSPLVGNVSIDCRDFIASGYRYHFRFAASQSGFSQSISNTSAAVDVDYIPLTAEVEDFDRSPQGPIIERFFLPVRIKTGRPNSPPTITTRKGNSDASSSEQLYPHFWADQFTTSTLTSDFLSATDDQTPADDLVFTVIKTPSTSSDDGFFVDVRRDVWRPITSFRQRDVIDGFIGYQPASREPAPDRVVEVQLTATDGLFATSLPARLLIGIRRTDPESPKITRNVGLTVGFGQRRRIGTDNLAVYDVSRRPEWIQIHVLRGGCRYGTIKVRGRPSDVFNVTDLERREVEYEHRGSHQSGSSDDNDEDFVMLRISNFRFSIRTKFTINIVRRLQQWPRRDQQQQQPVSNNRASVSGGRRKNHLETNVPTEVRQHGYAQITTIHLHAAFSGNSKMVSSDSVVYDVITPPRYGQLMTMYRPMTRGRTSTKFTQQDLDRGHVWYRHTSTENVNGKQNSRDSFRFVLRVGRFADSAKKPSLGDPATGNDVMQHDIVIRPHAFDRPPRPARNASRMVTVSESSVLVTLGRDSLSYVDAENPTDDVLFVVTCQPFFVADGGSRTGNSVETYDPQLTVDAGQIVYFDRTVARPLTTPSQSNDTSVFSPVSTIYPPLRTFTQSMIDADLVSYLLPFSRTDAIRSGAAGGIVGSDRRPVKVRFFFSVSDLHGNFDVDQSFDITILPAVESSEMTINYSSSKTMMESALSSGLRNIQRSASVIYVDEGEQATIYSSNLVSNGQSGTTDDVFEVLRAPINGVIQVDGQEVKQFTWTELTENLVSYRHTGGETGQVKRTDSATLIVQHRHARSGSENSTSETSAVWLIDLEFTIRPVDNSPPELTVGSLLIIGEGEQDIQLTSEAVMASDVDTDPDRLTFVVVETPVFGRLYLSKQQQPQQQANKNGRQRRTQQEQQARGAGVGSRRRGRSSNAVRQTTSGSGSSSARKRAVTAFTMSDLRNGSVHYVRRHSNSTQSMTSAATPSAPLFDSFKVYASDGQRNSAVGQVEIAFGRRRSSAPENLVTEVDFEVPESIEVERGGNRSFSVEIRRKSSTSETADQMSVSSKTPDVLMINLFTRPAHGKILLLSRGASSGSETDKLGPFESVLLSSLSNGESQLLYRHDGSSASQSDWFGLALADSSGYLRSATRKIEVTVRPGNANYPTLVTRRTLMAEIGISSVLSESHLKATDPDDVGGDVTNIRYDVVAAPTVGNLERRAESTAAATEIIRAGDSFTQADITAGRIVYIVTSGMADTLLPNSKDRFLFRLTDEKNVSPLTDTLEIEIIRGVSSEEDEDIAVQPTSSSPVKLTLDVNVPLTVIHGYRAVLSAANLHVVTSDNVPAEPSSLVYTIVEPPKHGKVIRLGPQSAAAGGGSEADTAIRSFTQAEVDTGTIEYKSDSSDESMMDYFLFTVGLSTASTPGPSTSDAKPLFFSVLIQPVTKIPASVIRRQPPERLLRLSGGGSETGNANAGGSGNGNVRFGFVFSADNMKAVHPLFDSRDIVYHLKSRPQHGFLEHLGSKRPIKRKFTQKDIDERRIAYILNDRTRAINDSFTYRIIDQNRNIVDDQRMTLEWSIIQFSQSQYIVCEDAQLLLVGVTRIGAVNRSASVNVRLKSLTAKEPFDFRNKSNALVDFAPGVTEVKWQVEIVNDGFREEIDEKFKILLENTSNAILGLTDKTQVHLVDFEDGQCTDYIGMITKQSASQSASSADGGVIPLVSNGRLSKSNKQRHSQGAFNRPRMQGRDDDDVAVGIGKRPHGESRSRTDDLIGDAIDDEYDDVDEYEDAVDNGGNFAPDAARDSSLLSSDLSFYMAPDSPDAAAEANSGSGRSQKIKQGGGNGQNGGSVAVQTAKQNADSRPNIQQPCSREAQGLLYFDFLSSKMYRCTDQRWEHWGWGMAGATSAPPTTAARRRPVGLSGTNHGRASSSSSIRGESRTSRRDLGSTAAKVRCPANWTRDGTRCHLLIAERVTWTEAERRCRTARGHVTNIGSWQELRRLSAFVGQKQFWTGIYSESTDYIDGDATDPDPDNQEDDSMSVRWINADGSRPSYYNWGPTLIAADSDYQSANTGNSRTQCIAVIGNRLQYVMKPCANESHRLPAVCSTPATASTTARSQHSRRRLQTVPGRTNG